MSPGRHLEASALRASALPTQSGWPRTAPLLARRAVRGNFFEYFFFSCLLYLAVVLVEFLLQLYIFMLIIFSFVKRDCKSIHK